MTSICLVPGCGTVVDGPVIGCAFHLSLLSRSLRCALRRAYRSRDAVTVTNVTTLAVREMAWRASMLHRAPSGARTV